MPFCPFAYPYFGCWRVEKNQPGMGNVPMHIYVFEGRFILILLSIFGLYEVLVNTCMVNMNIIKLNIYTHHICEQIKQIFFQVNHALSAGEVCRSTPGRSGWRAPCCDGESCWTTGTVGSLSQDPAEEDVACADVARHFEDSWCDLKLDAWCWKWVASWQLKFEIFWD